MSFQTGLIEPIQSEHANYSCVVITNATKHEIIGCLNANRYLGAQAFFLYIDRTFDRDEFKEFDNLYIQAAHQLYQGQSRPAFLDLQRLAYADAYAKCKTEWLAVFDVDEAIFHPNMKMSQFLSAQDSDCQYIRAPIYEAFWHSDETVFSPFSASHVRRAHTEKLDDSFCSELFGQHARFAKRTGVVGHPRGKYLVRTGLNFQPDIHEPIGEEAQVLKDDNLPGLLHYDAANYPIWFKKFGAGQGQEDGSKHNLKRRAIAGALQGNVFERTNLQLFASLYIWPQEIQDLYNMDNHIKKLSWKWGALYNFGGIDTKAKKLYEKRLKIDNQQRKFRASSESFLSKFFKTLGLRANSKQYVTKSKGDSDDL